MTADNPLRAVQQRAGAEFITVGSGDAAGDVLATFGAYESEYAAIRKGVGLWHDARRGVLRLTGADRVEFLHSLLTQDIKGMASGGTRRSLMLSDKGRILADMTIHHGQADTWLVLDRDDIAGVRAALEKKLFSEDVTIQDITQERGALSLLGPQAEVLLRAIGGDASPEKGTHQVMTFAGHHSTVWRDDLCGTLGLHLLTEDLPVVYETMIVALGGLSPEVEGGVRRTITGRGIGWLALNTARIEAGSALFHVDFGPDSLPAEAGDAVMQRCVSFTKGCYVGQEIVARMKNLGHPKQLLVQLRCKDDAMPIAGEQVFDAKDSSTIIGAVTSSTVSPLLGNVAIALAMLKWGRHRPGTTVKLPAEGRLVDATVVERLIT